MGVYTSAQLRWSLLLDDYPTTPPPAYDVVTDPPAPQEVADHTGPWCQATIVVPGRPAVVAARPLSGIRKGDTAAWRRRCAEVLGDALEIAGYPSDLDDLKLLARWRQRKASAPGVDHGDDHPVVDADPATIDAVLASLGSRRATLEAWARDQGLWPPGAGDVDRLLVKAAELATDEVFVGPEPAPADDSQAGGDPVAQAREFLASVGAPVPDPEPVAEVDDDLAADMDLLDERLAEAAPEVISRMARFCEVRGYPEDLSAMHRHEFEDLLDWLVAEGILEDQSP